MISNPSPSRTRGTSGTGNPSLLSAGRMLAAAAMLGFTGCLTQEQKGEAPLADKAFLFSVTTDYKTGSYSAFGIDSAFTRISIAPIHSDAVVRFLGGNDIFVINRLGRDNLQVIDRHNLRTVLEFGFDALSNPQDVALKDSLIYVSFQAKNKIGIYHEREGELKGEIDVSAFADADGQAETSSLLFIGGNLYALTQNLGTASKVYTYGIPHLLKIDPVSRKVTKSMELTYTNPGSMGYDSAKGMLYIPCLGNYGANDGGILAIDISKFEIADTVATEGDLGGDIGGLLVHDGKLFLDVNTASADKIIAVSANDGKVEGIADLDPYSLGGMAIDVKTSTLYFGDRSTPSIRAFDLMASREKEDSKVVLGTPSTSLAVIR